MKFKIMHESAGRIRVQMLAGEMTPHQADILQAFLQSTPGVLQAAVHERTSCAIIYYNCRRSDLLDALCRFSYKKCPTDLVIQGTGRELNRKYEEKLVTLVTSKLIRTLFFPAPLRILYTAVKAAPYILRGLKCLFSGRLHVELLDGISIAISIIRRDFDTAASIMFLLRLGELLEEWTRKKSVDDLARCMSLNIDRVWLKNSDGSEVLTAIANVKQGDCICVRVGGVIPLDGIIEHGEVMVNQASLTGESVPVPKRPGTTVYAGTVVEEGECTIRVSQQSGQNRYDKIVGMIEQSEKLKSAAENKASNLADRLVPYTLAFSAVTYAATGNLTRALSVLMVDFSCALKLSMPLAVLSAMRETGTYHVTVKGGKYLEAVAKADTIIFDKTGTLTHACPVVADVIVFGSYDKNDILRLAACLEEHFPHSMANAVVQAARDRGLSHEEMHSEVEYLVAHGIASTVGGSRVIIGSAHFVFEDERCAVPAGYEERFSALPGEYSHLYMAVGGILAAVICISDPLRSEARRVISALRELGIKKAVMLTGDSERTAAAIAAQVGVDEYRSEVLPEDKVRFVEQQRAMGHTVIMLGDGINDSPALSAADAGVAISDGAAIAREIADITIAADNLFELVTLRTIACRLIKRINSNYRFVMGFNGCLILLGAAGILPPASSAMLHNISTLGVSLRSMTNLLDDNNNI